MPDFQLTGFGAFRGMLSFKWAPSPLIVAEDYDKSAAYVENMQPPLMASRRLAIGDVRENFEAEHGPDGDAWEEWSDSYVESGPPGPPDGILKLTYDLMDSSTSPAAYPITARELFFDFGAVPEYGIYHQLGAPDRASGGRGVTREQNIAARTQLLAAGFTLAEGIGANALPARPFAGIEEETAFAIIDVFDQWFSGAISMASGTRTPQLRVAGGRFGRGV